MSYSHSIINDCHCIHYVNMKLPSTVDNFDESDLNILLKNTKKIETRITSTCCGFSEKKIIHCNRCRIAEMEIDDTYKHLCDIRAENYCVY